MTLEAYINRYYKDRDIDITVDGDTLTTYHTFSSLYEIFRESVDTYKLASNAKNKGFTVIRKAGPRELDL